MSDYHQLLYPVGQAPKIRNVIAEPVEWYDRVAQVTFVCNGTRWRTIVIRERPLTDVRCWYMTLSPGSCADEDAEQFVADPDKFARKYWSPDRPGLLQKARVPNKERAYFRFEVIP